VRSKNKAVTINFLNEWFKSLNETLRDRKHCLVSSRTLDQIQILRAMRLRQSTFCDILDISHRSHFLG